jgi:hypothetical protein
VVTVRHYLILGSSGPGELWIMIKVRAFTYYIMYQILPAECEELGDDDESVVDLDADHSGVCKIGATPADVYNFTLIRRNIADLFEDALQRRELSNMPFVIDHRGRAQAVDDNEFQAMRGWPSQREIVLNTDVDVNLDNFFHTKSYVLFKKAFTNNF